MSLPNFNTDPAPVSGLVTIPTPNAPGNATHSIQLFADGPPREPGQPMVLVLTGLTSAATEWASFVRLLSSRTRVLTYNRAGYGESDESGEFNPPTPEIVAEELERLLSVGGVEGPWVLVVHSWGGTTGREFLERVKTRSNGQGIVGMILVDTMGAEWREKEGLDWPSEDWIALLGDNFPSLDVLFPDMNSRRAITAQEWEAFLEEENSPKHMRQAGREYEAKKGGEKILMEKRHLDEEMIAENGPILGDWPVSVLQANFRLDLLKIYNYGVKNGLGTEQQRKGASEWMSDEFDRKAEEINRRQLRLSRKGRFKTVESSGHNVQMTEPEAIVEEVLWVLDEVRQMRG